MVVEGSSRVREVKNYKALVGAIRPAVFVLSSLREWETEALTS